MRQLRNDVALLQLEKPIQASSKVNTVCLPSSGSRAPAGSRCYITGITEVLVFKVEEAEAVAVVEAEAAVAHARTVTVAVEDGPDIAAIIPMSGQIVERHADYAEKPLSARVINGEDALQHAWPWQISLRVNGRHICGGSLIKPDWVLTAAHCVASNTRPSGYTVVVACGQKPFSARVVNGQNASPHAWPWQISLRVNGRHICGGSLIRPDWVLTAAHCVDRNPSPSGYTVVVGAHTRTGSTSVQQTFRLRQLFKHENFNMRQLRNDVALLQLERAAQISSKVNTVCLPSGGQAQTGAQCYITGWGRTVGGGSAATTLQQAMLPVASHSDCSRVNGKLVAVDQRSMICAGGRGKGGCQGDSGGPFVCNEGGRWVLRGAVSWGHGQCRTDHYTVFARVNSFVSWINQKIGKKLKTVSTIEKEILALNG
ncbi:hypothetical protein QZH41_017826 [Actinostola sp. cb2023]|nr:hypothetical protein QZH41_017826 [Actinostola sp. cb2023]